MFKNQDSQLLLLMRYLVLLLLLTDSFFVAVTAVVADLLLVAAVSDFADAETEDEVVSVATADFADSIPENCISQYTVCMPGGNHQPQKLKNRVILVHAKIYKAWKPLSPT